MTKAERIAKFSKRIARYQKDPVLFAKEVCSFSPDPWQKNVLLDLASHTKVSVRSGHGVGKTSCEAMALLWFLSCFRYPKVIATAPTRQQLNDILWSEIEKWRSRSPLLKELLTWTKTYVYMKGYEKRWFAVAKTASEPENMQGFHEENMLIIVDEASGVEDDIMEALLATLSGKNNKLLMCANPTRTTGTFFDSHNRDRDLYCCHRVSSLDSRRTNKENIASFIRKYGEESNVVRVRIYGDFPVAEDDVFIPLPLLEKSIQTDYTPRSKPQQIHIGCDVARFGDDKTVITYRTDEKVEIYKKRNGQDTMKTADDILQLGNSLVEKYRLDPRKDDPIPVKVDDGGVGGGVVDRLRQVKRNNPELYWWLEVFPIKFGAGIQHKYFDDSTTYMMSVLRNLLQPHDEDGNSKPVEVILPDDDNLIAQLSSRKYNMTDKGKLRVESKKVMKDRGLPSPDEADSVLLVCLPVNLPKKKNRGEVKR